MKRLAIVVLLVVSILSVQGAASTRYIVRDQLGLLSLKTVCSLLGCSVLGGLDGTLGQLFLVSSDTLNPTLLLSLLLKQLGVVDVEFDQTSRILQASSGGAPQALYDTAPVSYYGATVIHGYVGQPAAQIINLSTAQAGFNVSGN